MDCRSTERLIYKFIDESIGKQELEHFVEHMEHCDSCMEELSIQYLVSEGMIRLEEGNTFDLKQELDNRIAHAKKKIRMRHLFRRLLYVLEMAVILAILIITIMVAIL